MVIGDANNGSGITLSNFVFKAEVLDTSIANGYLADPKLYCTKGTFYGQDQGETVNAYARFDPSFISSDNTFGFVGGVPDIMANLNWTPIARDFTLTRGNLIVHPTQARFWKFEMTNLVAEPYSVYMPQVPVTTQMMPSSAASPGVSSSYYQGAVPAGTNSQIAMAYGEQGFKRSTMPMTSNADPRISSPTTIQPGHGPDLGRKVPELRLSALGAVLRRPHGPLGGAGELCRGGDRSDTAGSLLLRVRYGSG